MRMRNIVNIVGWRCDWGNGRFAQDELGKRPFKESKLALDVNKMYSEDTDRCYSERLAKAKENDGLLLF